MSEDNRKSLTRHELDAARIIQEYHDTVGRSPSLSELANELDMATRSGAHRMAVALRNKGWIKPSPRRSYSLELTARVPLAPEIGDPRAVATVALEAIDQLKRIMGDTGIALNLAQRLHDALGGDQPHIELGPKKCP